MKFKSLAAVITFYTIALVVALALLVLWIIYVVTFHQTISTLAAQLGLKGDASHWIFLSIGCTLLILLIVFLSLQFAQSISRILFIRKQDEFVANMTHELKSPLAAIKLHSQTLKTSDLTDQEKTSFLDLIDQQVIRMTRLVNQGLEINRLRSQKEPLKLQKINLKQTLTPLLNEIEKRLTQKNYNFIPSPIDSNIEIYADELALERIVENLITNSQHASHPQGKIGIDIKSLSDKIELVIWDEGIGIPRHEIQKIFKRFYQIGSEIRAGRQGTGLGLAIVKGLVKEMNGSILVESKPEHGTKFILKFPKV